MPRRGSIPKRKVKPDAAFNSKLVTKFINSIMLDGKKSLAQKIFYGGLVLVERKTGKDANEIFQRAVKNVMPVLEVRPRRVGGSTYQVPIEVRSERRETLAIRWLLAAAKKRGERTMQQRLANELIDAANNTGTSVKKKEDTHRMAEANKAFAHYRW